MPPGEMHGYSAQRRREDPTMPHDSGPAQTDRRANSATATTWPRDPRREDVWFIPERLHYEKLTAASYCRPAGLTASRPRTDARIREISSLELTSWGTSWRKFSHGETAAGKSAASGSVRGRPGRRAHVGMDPEGARLSMKSSAHEPALRGIDEHSHAGRAQDLRSHR